MFARAAARWNRMRALADSLFCPINKRAIRRRSPRNSFRSHGILSNTKSKSSCEEILSHNSRNAGAASHPSNDVSSSRSVLLCEWTPVRSERAINNPINPKPAAIRMNVLIMAEVISRRTLWLSLCTDKFSLSVPHSLLLNLRVRLAQDSERRSKTREAKSEKR